VVKITISGCCQLQCSEAYVVKSLVIDAEGLVRIFDQLMNRKGSVVRLANEWALVCMMTNMKLQTSTTVSETLGLGTTE
jgi:hypothetical protein